MIDAEAMNSVTEKNRRGRRGSDQGRNGWHPGAGPAGLEKEAIAARLGCKVGTLKVRCSQAQISLRVPKEVKVVPLVPLVPVPTPPKSPRSNGALPLPCRPHCNSAELRCPACASGRKPPA